MFYGKTLHINRYSGFVLQICCHIQRNRNSVKYWWTGLNIKTKATMEQLNSNTTATIKKLNNITATNEQFNMNTTSTNEQLNSNTTATNDSNTRAI